ncbi:MAG: hypothetical protein DRQ01_07835 [Ignavibacteriae bacterium]|nr:MAG: hypothetical protein DRQ01_07835 [Ignavibacteriota bacterium]
MYQLTISHRNSFKVQLEKEIGVENSTEQIQKKEKLVTRLIIIISISIGILITFVFAGLLDFFY